MHVHLPCAEFGEALVTAMTELGPQYKRDDPPTREVLRRISLVWATIANLVAHSLILPPEVWAWPDGDQPRKLLALNRHLTEGKKNPP